MTCKSKLIEYLKENSKYGFQTETLVKKLNIKAGTVHHIKFMNKDKIESYRLPGNKTYYIIKENV